MSQPSDHDREALLDLIASFERCFTEGDLEGLKALWDPADDSPFYIAEEVEAPLIGMPALEGYWHEQSKVLAAVSLRSWDHRFKMITDDVASALFRLHWNALQQGITGHPIGGDVKVSAVFKRTGDGWRFVHYAESALGPLPFLRKIYRRHVDPDFTGRL